MKVNKLSALLSTILIMFLFNSCKMKQEEVDYTQYVDVFIGTGGHGHVHPAATLPFGMVQLGPDTGPEPDSPLWGWDWTSGYHYSSESIMGFSHTRLSGAGAGELLDVLVMPVCGKPLLNVGTRKHPELGYRSRFSHTKEKASPGYYSVLLSDDSINVELTVTERVGFHKYTFNKQDSAFVMIDLSHMSVTKKEWNCELNDVSFKILNDSTIVGSRTTTRFAKNRTVYFAIRLAKPSKNIKIIEDFQPDTAVYEAKHGPYLGYIGYKVNQNETIMLKTAISGVSTEGALLNLNELAHWNFDLVKTNAQKQWNSYLSKIEVETEDLDLKKIFYTSMYHSLVVPNLYMDADSNYRGFDKKIHQAKGFSYYSNFSLWDTYRAAHPLYYFVANSKVKDFVSSMLAMTTQNPDGFMPVWPLHSEETYCMIACHSISVVSDAIMKSVSGFDYKVAYNQMKIQVQNKAFKEQKYYLEYGYCPYDLVPDFSVSTSLEYAYNEWCVAQVALKLGYTSDYKYYMNRSQNCKLLFDKSINLMRPRKSDGTWFSPFNPDNIQHFVEANTWQYTWSVQQNPRELINLMGGNKSFETMLDSTFTHSMNKNENAHDMTGLIGSYVHGNEPSHHIPYLYNYVGAWSKTQKYVHQICRELYSAKPDGLCGNDDLGQISAWYVLSAMGFYPVNPASNEYALSSPLFKKISIRLDNGRVLNITNANPAKIASSATFNGQKLEKPFLSYQMIQEGGTLEFE